MPQYRKLATKTLESFDFNGLADDFARLTWCLLPLVACRDGRGIDIPTWLIGHLYPLREDVTPAMIEAAMVDFAAHGMVMRYSVAGRRYFQIVNWARYQGVTDKEATSPYPAPELVESYAGVGRELVGSKSASDADADADAEGDATRARPTTPQEQPTPKKSPSPSPKVKTRIPDRTPAGFQATSGYHPPPEPDPPPVDKAQALAVGEMANAITDVTGISARLNWSDPKGNGNGVGDLAADLVAEGYTPEQVRACYGQRKVAEKWHWYEMDWRGKPPRSEMPSIKAIRETIAGAVTHRPAGQVEQENGGQSWVERSIELARRNGLLPQPQTG